MTSEQIARVAYQAHVDHLSKLGLANGGCLFDAMHQAYRDAWLAAANAIMDAQEDQRQSIDMGPLAQKLATLEAVSDRRSFREDLILAFVQKLRSPEDLRADRVSGTVIMADAIILEMKR